MIETIREKADAYFNAVDKAVGWASEEMIEAEQALRQALSALESPDIEGLRKQVKANVDDHFRMFGADRGELGSVTFDKTIELLAAAQGFLCQGWRPKEEFETNGTEVIGWLSSDKGFPDMTAHLYYVAESKFYETGWYWNETDEPVKRPDLIKGCKPWPLPPITAAGGAKG